MRKRSPSKEAFSLMKYERFFGTKMVFAFFTHKKILFWSQFEENKKIPRICFVIKKKKSH